MLTAALAIGVVVSLLLTEFVGLSAGGIVTPGYVALLLDRPAALVMFLIIALACHGVVSVLGRYVILYGNRRFAVAVLCGVTLSLATQIIIVPALPAPVEWLGIGLVVPGLIAHQFDRQGVWPTLAALAVAAPLVRLVLLVALRT